MSEWSESRIRRGLGWLAVAALALSGCSRDWDPGRVPAGPQQAEAAAAGVAADGVGAGAAGAAGRAGLAAFPGIAGDRPAFAALPDRGELVGYPRQRVVRQQGAYTWHRADVSEAHALRAIVDGVLRLTTPDGRQLSFQYERHVEHPSGDWTWVGRLLDAPGGREAILTFGAEAVFGSIAQPSDQPLRLAMRDGASWLVETDAALQASAEGRVLRHDEPDYLVPPALAAAQAARPAGADAAASSGSDTGDSPNSGTAGATTSSATVVDILVGYTPGFATAQGGASAAVTRINFLVEVGNQGFANSQVDARLRLVHAMQVDYPDATDNGETLEKMTGYKSGSGQTTPDPAFSALRAARDTYGADLVTLVRKFSDPENDGCGIAWLIGGEQTPIQQGHEYFGYSVASDGQDEGADGKTYYCRDETMVHEFGHNMGSAHDIETAKGDDGVLDADEYGRYPYSFGYRTAAGSGDFYTIMAYGEKRDAAPYQTAYRVFSNPRIAICGGFPCGIENQADNARSLGQTIPTIASFRAQVVEDAVPPQVRNDVDGNGIADLLWREDRKTRFAYWIMVDGKLGPSSAFSVGPQWSVVASADFTGDGRVDVVWSNGSQLHLWIGNGTTFDGGLIRAIPSGWKVVGAGDIDGDGKADLLWRDDARNRFAYWIMDGRILVRSQAFNVGPDWHLAAHADFSGDGKLDLVWASTASLEMWTGNGTAFSGATIRRYPTGWTIVDSGDFNGDGRADLFWRNDQKTQFTYWTMDGAVLTSVGTFSIGPEWRMATAGDFSGDGRADVVWASSTQLLLWNASGSGFTSAPIRAYPAGWTLLR